jgi:hypothetical protein
MNATAYSVLTTSHFDRLMKKFAPKHPELVKRFEKAVAILSVDPYNKSQEHPIRKLRGLLPEKASTGCARGDSAFVTISRGSRWCSTIVGCGARIRIDRTPGSFAAAVGTWGTVPDNDFDISKEKEILVFYLSITV